MWSGHNGTTILQLIQRPQKINTCQIFLPPKKPGIQNFKPVNWNPEYPPPHPPGQHGVHNISLKPEGRSAQQEKLNNKNTSPDRLKP